MIGGQQLLAGDAAFFEQGLAQLDVRIDDILDGTRPRFRYIVEECDLGVQVRAYSGRDGLGKQEHV
mgnify:CR=1 FL=1